MKRTVNRLRCLRITLEILFGAALFCSLSYGFPSLRHIGQTQLGSNLLAACANFSAVALLFHVLILVLTWFFGRGYCSVLCPLGILQDVMGLLHRGKYRHATWKRFIREPLFILLLVLAIHGLMLPLTLLMPSANFFIIVQYAMQGIIRLLQQYFQNLPQLQTIQFMPQVQLTAWAIFMLLLAGSIWKGRLFCNTLCPVGALLAKCASHTHRRITIDADKCVSCGACEGVCKSTCIDSVRKRVVNKECVLCMNCLSVCPKDAIHYQKVTRKSPEVQHSRRLFMIDSATLAAGIALGNSFRIVAKRTSRPAPIMPPGAGDIDRFNARCVGCGLCIASCKGKTLKPAVNDYGIKGFLQPVVDPYRGPCEFTCNQCSQVCPCGALTPLPLPVKQRTRIGLAHWIQDRCVAYKDGQACGACAEHCPVGALEMIPFKGITIPKVNADLCIGCGACQNICPIRPEAAIVVQGVSRQTDVMPPKVEKQDKLASEEDFPF